MDQEPSNTTAENQVTIEPPNIHDQQAFEGWLDKYVTKIPKGFEDLKHPDGTPYSPEEQLEATRQQLRLVADSFKQLGFDDQGTVQTLMDFVSPGHSSIDKDELF